MKLNSIIYIILCLSLPLYTSNADLTLQPKSSITIEVLPTGLPNIHFFFNSESIAVGKERIFQMKSLKNSLSSNSINYKFVGSTTDVIPDADLISVNFETSSDLKREVKDSNGTDFQIEYFKISKADASQKLIYFTYTINHVGTAKIYVEITSLEKLPVRPSSSSSKTDNNYLKKYGQITVDASEYTVYFDSSGFKEGEEMHFKIKAYSHAYVDYYSTGVYYEFVNVDNPNLGNSQTWVDFSIKVDYEYDSQGEQLKTKYFTIKKDKLYFNGGDGSLLAITFYLDYGSVTITNTETDEGKIVLKPWAVAVIVVAVVLIIGFSIFCFCWRRKRALARAAATNAYAPAVGVSPYPPGAYPPSQPYY